jgi:hypothetical protein
MVTFRPILLLASLLAFATAVGALAVAYAGAPEPKLAGPSLIKPYDPYNPPPDRYEAPRL